MLLFLKAPRYDRAKNISLSYIAKLCLLIFVMCFIIDFLTELIIIKYFHPLRVLNFKNLECFSPILKSFIIIVLLPIGYELLFRTPISLFSNYKKAFLIFFMGWQ